MIRLIQQPDSLYFLFFAMSSPSNQTQEFDVDDRHLKRLSQWHHLCAVAQFIGVSVLIWHYLSVKKDILLSDRQKLLSPHETVPEDLLHLVSVIYLVLGLFTLVLAILNVISALAIARRQKRLLSLITAGLNCVQIPLGTALGAYTLLVLCSNSVRAKYDQAEGEALDHFLR